MSISATAPILATVLCIESTLDTSRHFKKLVAFPSFNPHFASKELVSATKPLARVPIREGSSVGAGPCHVHRRRSPGWKSHRMRNHPVVNHPQIHVRTKWLEIIYGCYVKKLLVWKTIFSIYHMIYYTYIYIYMLAIKLLFPNPGPCSFSAPLP